MRIDPGLARTDSGHAGIGEHQEVWGAHDRKVSRTGQRRGGSSHRGVNTPQILMLSQSMPQAQTLHAGKTRRSRADAYGVTAGAIVLE